MDEEAHELLGVSFDATSEEVKEAYREMVKKHHPDVSDEPNAEEKFLRIRDAYEEMTERAERHERKDETEEKTGAEEPYTYTDTDTNTDRDFSSTHDVPPSGEASDSERKYSDSAWVGDESSDFSSTTEDFTTHTGKRKQGRKSRKATGTEASRRRDTGDSRHEDSGVRIEGLRGGWEILRDTIDEEGEVNWFVHKPRNGYYLNSEAGRTKTRYGFGSRSEARKTYKDYRESNTKSKSGSSSRRVSTQGYHIMDKIDKRWRLVRGPRGFAIMSRGHPATYLDSSGEEVINARWFDKSEEAMEAHENRTARAKPEVGLGKRARLFLAPFLLPFFGVLKLFGVVNEFMDVGMKEYRPYAAGVTTTVLLFTMAFVLESSVIVGFAVVTLTILSVWLLSPYAPADSGRKGRS